MFWQVYHTGCCMRMNWIQRKRDYQTCLGIYTCNVWFLHFVSTIHLSYQILMCGVFLSIFHTWPTLGQCWGPSICWDLCTLGGVPHVFSLLSTCGKVIWHFVLCPLCLFVLWLWLKCKMSLFGKVNIKSPFWWFWGDMSWLRELTQKWVMRSHLLWVISTFD